ncbi:MAG: PQQ-dependent sugar dehydrogenase, partial [Sandarakinorhabdus sp.]
MIMIRTRSWRIAALLAAMPVGGFAQPVDTPGVTAPLTPAQITRNYPPDALSGAAVDKPVVLKSEGGMAMRVVKLAQGLSHPDGLVFLPDGRTMLLTERGGKLRVVTDGVLNPVPVAGLPDINNVGIGGLHDIVLHPDFARNKLLY